MRYWNRAVLIATLALIASPALAQKFSTGQTVYATPSGAINGWFSGCVIGNGRNNRSYQVDCGSEMQWVSEGNISATPPVPKPNPDNPGAMVEPTVTPAPR